MLAYLFPGQGSQSRGMGNHLFDEFPEIIAQADEVLGYSIKTLCLEDPEQKLNQTQYTQPALYTVNALSYLDKLRKTKLKPDFVAGHSLGEYNALFAAEVFDFKTGLNLVKKRGELMSKAQDGSMAAVIGLQADALQQLLDQNHLSDITIANFNTYKQLVISGLKKDIERIQPLLKDTPGVSFIPLKVSGAFHSFHMLSAQQKLMDFFRQFKFSTPTIPIIANFDAKLYHPAVVESNLVNQITHSVQWVKTIEYLQSHENLIFEEIGPGRVLSGLINRIKVRE